MLIPNNSKYLVQKVLIILLILNNIISAQISNINKEHLQPDAQSSNLPLIIINTNGQSIQDQERIVAHMGIINNGVGNRNYLTDRFNDYDGFISVELRGSSSSTYPKPQFRFETQDSMGENLNVSLCGLPTENDWILNGPYADKSLIRNVFSYNISNQIGRYASRTVYCELILNGEYLGLYILMEKLKRDNDRVNISKLTELDNSGDELTGGYIIKIDKFDGENIGYWLSNKGTPFQYHYPKADEITQEQIDYIQKYFNDFEEMMSSSNYNDHLIGYEIFIDIDSFVDHFILNEFAKNVDAYRLSAFLHKDKDSINPKLIAGPIWDFNLTFGDAWIPEEVGFSEGWQIDYSKIHVSDPFKVPFWWEKLTSDNNFMSKVKLRWSGLRTNLLSHNSLFATIDSIVANIREGSERNFQRWPEVLSGTHNDEILRLKGWILRRLLWIDITLEQITSVDNIDNISWTNNLGLLQNYPNPFNPTTSIQYNIPVAALIGVEVLQHATLKVYDLLGRELTTLVNEKQKPGIYEIEWNAENQPSGIYFYKLMVGSTNSQNSLIKSKKMLLLK